MKRILFVILTLCASFGVSAQQVTDPGFNPALANPEYPGGEGPLIFVDGGHHNFHTINGGYRPFARLLANDGYLLKEYTGKFKTSQLAEGKIVIIVNALNEHNVTRWYKPTLSAFTAREVKTLENWVKQGGSLFLIADHMPMGGAAKDLAETFGFGFTDGFAMDTARTGPDFFSIEEGTLSKCSITEGRNDMEKVDKVVTFTGQGFTIPDGATSVIQFNGRYQLVESDTAWVFGPETTFSPLEGWSQGAYMDYGKGRVVMFGEAAMFTAQLAGPQQIKAGMNSDYAEQNYQLLLNIIHWLDRRY